MTRCYHIRLIFIALIIFVIFSYSVFYIFKSNDKHIRSLRCYIYTTQSSCLKTDEDVYLPSSEIVKLFDVSGYFDKEQDSYYLNNNNAHVDKGGTYDYNSSGSFLFFDQYNVELRSKVKWISVDENIPISTQWSKSGYKYPIQIAQYGLSHYSKWFNLKKQKLTIEPFNLILESYSKSVWDMTHSDFKHVKITRNGLDFFSTQIVSETALPILSSLVDNGNNADLSLMSLAVARMPQIDTSLPEFLLIGSNWRAGSALHIRLKNDVLGVFHILYACGDFPRSQPFVNVFIYSLKDCSNVRLVRNLYVDMVKVMPAKVIEDNATIVTDLKKSSIDRVVLYGQGTISNFQICNQFSYEKFLITADWFVSNQDGNGGWSTNVTRRIYSNVKLDPGWYSAMAQGHGISVLMRAYHSTNDNRYMLAASRALRLFEIDSKNNGVRAHFLGQGDFVWYEEYPVQPSLFVLNGFIYSLFGLLDFVRISKSESSREKATELLNLGISSLQTLLPLFDSGAGSFYDLRHVTFPAGGVQVFKRQIRPGEVHDGPNRARPEYHALHIKQLLYLGHALNPPKKAFISTAQRFTEYLKGYRSSHN